MSLRGEGGRLSVGVVVAGDSAAVPVTLEETPEFLDGVVGVGQSHLQQRVLMCQRFDFRFQSLRFDFVKLLFVEVRVGRLEHSDWA